MSNPNSAAQAAKSRTLAIALAVAGLVGMFFALLGWSAHVHERHLVWFGLPLVWTTIGLLISVAAAAADSALGADADFTQNSRGAGAKLANRFLPWIIVALTLLGMVLMSLKGA